jgi:alkanesulfonate monooxygenase SsuD/methylene tetrahydromethanopterin reductase-like flavin-dependent oxidoreductase (luciferase family)
VADGWLPSLGGHYLSPEDALTAHGAIDEAASAAGRDPAQIERAVNVMALQGDAGGWADQLARIASELRFSTLLVSVGGEDPVGFVRRLGEDVAPRVRALLG